MVLGQTGQLATALQRSKRSDLAFFGRSDVDLADPAAAKAFVLAHRPVGVILAAAYTAVDKAESEPELAHVVNADSPGAVASACASLNIPLVHVSTDYVFSGQRGSPLSEDDPVAPMGVYGRTKQLGEHAVQTAGARAAIVRTSWVYGPTGSNFVRTMLRLATLRDEVGVVADQTGRPTHVDDLATACLSLIDRLVREEFRPEEACEIYHYASSDDATWADLAEAVFAAAAGLGLPYATVRRIETKDFPTPAARPTYSSLATDKIRALGIDVFPWRERVKACVSSIAQAADTTNSGGTHLGRPA